MFAGGLLMQFWAGAFTVTYRKNVKDVWPEAEFSVYEVPIPGGASTRMKLATRQTQLGTSKSPRWPSRRYAD